MKMIRKSMAAGALALALTGAGVAAAATGASATTTAAVRYVPPHDPCAIGGCFPEPPHPDCGPATTAAMDAAQLVSDIRTAIDDLGTSYWYSPLALREYIILNHQLAYAETDYQVAWRKEEVDCGYINPPVPTPPGQEPRPAAAAAVLALRSGPSQR